MMQTQLHFWKMVFGFIITATLFVSVHTLFRGYRETCGTHLHARSRDTVAEGRQCDKSKGLACTRLGVCDCVSSVGGDVDRMFWNKTHCVIKLNSTCRITQSQVPELSFLPNVTRTEELFCGSGAVCTDDGCACEPEFHPDLNRLNCISDSGQSALTTHAPNIALSLISCVTYAFLLLT